MTIGFGPLPWSTQVRNSVGYDHAKVFELLDQPSGNIRVRGGFFTGSRKVSFAELCVKEDCIELLEEVLERAPAGITIADVCALCDFADGPDLEVIAHVSDWHPAVESVNFRVSPRLLDIALRYQPGHDSLFKPQEQHLGLTVRAHTLIEALKSEWTSLSATLFGMVCKLRDAGAPSIAANATSTPAAQLLYTLCSTRWSDASSPHAEAHLKMLVDAGDVDIEALLISKVSPLQTAIQFGNGHCAAALMRLGCSLEMSGGDFADPISLAQNTPKLSVERRAKTVALVTEAYMTMRATASATASNTSQAEIAPPARRVRAV
jgi:hypothetical protein